MVQLNLNLTEHVYDMGLTKDKYFHLHACKHACTCKIDDVKLSSCVCTRHEHDI